MAKKTNSTLNSTTKKGESSKKTTTTKKGKTSKLNIFKSIWNFTKNHKISVIVGSTIIILIIFILLYFKLQLGFTAVLIGEDEYSKADMNMTLYNLKYSYFGKDASEIPDATLDEQLSSVGMSVSDYLKSLAVNELKYQSIIKSIAKDNNIKLDDSDYKMIEKTKNEVVESFDSHSKFVRFLRKNGINEEAYDKYLEANKLYDKVFNELYKNGDKYFNDEELKEVKTNYNNTYYKVNQIVLATVDKSTLKELDKTIINQKEALINTIKSKLDGGEEFIKLIEMYSEEQSEDNVLYFTKDDVLDSVYNTVVDLEVDEISDIVKTDYAYTIIKRLELDDKKLEDFIDSSLKDKFNKDITNLSEDYKVIYENIYKDIK